VTTVTNQEFCAAIRELMDRWDQAMTWCQERGMTELEAAKLVGEKFTEEFFPKKLQDVRQPTMMNNEGGKK
jgi:hypothetical protein